MTFPFLADLSVNTVASYVALNTLNKVVSVDTNAVQRHRNIILDCLRDGDISIRRRALELSYALINEQNVRVLVRELLAFLEVADDEFKTGMTTQISLAAERFAPNKRWHIDTVLRTLKLAGNFVREEILSSFIRLVAHTPELQAYTASKLYTALQADISQESLTLAAVWIIGEYSEILLESGIVDEEQPKHVSFRCSRSYSVFMCMLGERCGCLRSTSFCPRFTLRKPLDSPIRSRQYY